MGIYGWLVLYAFLLAVALVWMMDELTHGGLDWTERVGACAAATAGLWCVFAGAVAAWRWVAGVL